MSPVWGPGQRPVACGRPLVPKVALALRPATCSGATSEDGEGLSREPCAHVWGSRLDRGLSKDTGLGRRESFRKGADQGGETLDSGSEQEGRGALGPGPRCARGRLSCWGIWVPGVGRPVRSL